MGTNNRLSALEADCLAHLAARSRAAVPGPDFAFAELTDSGARTIRRLIKKGYADDRGSGKYGLTQAGVERSTQIY